MDKEAIVMIIMIVIALETTYKSNSGISGPSCTIQSA